MNHNDFREIIDDAPETGADTNTGTSGGAQPGSADNGVPAGNAAHGAQTGSEAPRAEDGADHESTSGAGEVMQSSASDDTDQNQDTEYEDICYICRRPEHIAGKMIRIPNNICICQDCMQKTFDSMNGSGFSMDDMMNMNMGRIPNISMINLSDLQGGLPNNQKLKKKKPKAQSEPVIDIKKIPAPHKIKASLDEYVVGQEQAKKVMSVAVYNHYKRIAADEKDGVEIEKSNMLMIGPTGCGKTYLVKTLARLLDVPLAITDATSLTEAGYIGDDIESVVSKLLAAADNDVERAEHGIIFIDEIDKIAKKRNTNQRDVSGESVQQGKLKDEYDKDENLLSKVTVEDVRKFGMIPEFLGRLPILFTLEPLSEDTLVRILQEPKNAILKQYEKLLAMDEVKLAFDEDALRAIAHKAKEKKVGARALRAVIEEFMLDIMYEIPKDDNIGMVTITKDYVEKKGSPVITLRGCIGIGSTENPQIAASN